jgi:hypothetical protein
MDIYKFQLTTFIRPAWPYCKASNYHNPGPKGFTNFEDFWKKVFKFKILKYYISIKKIVCNIRLRIKTMTNVSYNILL